LNNLGGMDQPDNSVDFKCVFDAIRIADRSEALKAGQPEEGRNAAVDEPFLTQTGKKIMEQVLGKSVIRP